MVRVKGRISAPMKGGMRARIISLAAVVAVVAAACGGGDVAVGGRPQGFVTVVDEGGRPVRGAVVEVQTGRFVTDDEGVARVRLAGPVAGTVSAAGMLTEPVVIGAGGEVAVRLWARRGPTGETRTAIHLGGDVMLGRRYLRPGRAGTATVAEGDGGVSAAAVVADLAPLLAAADLTVVNLETVVGDPDPAAALPGKRFLLRSPPEIVAALRSMGVDVATSGNNHSYDWGAEGLVTTAETLGAAGIAVVGAGLDEASARRPAVVATPGGDVTVLSYTTLGGDQVNDRLPGGDVPIPADLAPEEAWMFESRRFGYGRPGDTVWLAPSEMRPGDAWRWFAGLEATLGDDEVEALWAALTDTFPELQDWVARRGHGGAALFAPEDVAADVGAAGPGLVIVALHSGFQYAATGSEYMRRAARSAIDAGADLVVAHHPHVLQGFEWYRDRLIAHSLGNLVFDQDLLSTFPTGFLRVVYEGERLLEARLVPVLLDGYRPVPVAGEAAARIRGLVNAAGLAPGPTARMADGGVGVVVGDTGSVGIVGADGRIGRRVEADRRIFVTGPDGVVDLPPGTVIRDAGPEVEVGRDLGGWGWFDDTEADGEPKGGANWAFATASEADLVAADDEALRLYTGGSLLRPVGRVYLDEHRVFDDDGTPLDAEPRYSLRFRAKAPVDLDLAVRVDAYRVEDRDPWRPPRSEIVARTWITVPIDGASRWDVYDIEIPASALAMDGGQADAIMIYLRAVARRAAAVTVDDVRLLEWRAGSVGWTAADALKTSEPRAEVGVVVLRP